MSRTDLSQISRYVIEEMKKKGFCPAEGNPLYVQKHIEFYEGDDWKPRIDILLNHIPVGAKICGADFKIPNSIGYEGAIETNQKMGVRALRTYFSWAEKEIVRIDIRYTV